MFISIANTFIGTKNHKKLKLKFSMAAILKICKLTLFPGSHNLWLLFWDSTWPIKAVKTQKWFVGILCRL